MAKFSDVGAQPPGRGRFRGKLRYVVALLGVLLFLGVLGAVKSAQISTLIAAGEAQQAAGPPPEAVSTAVANEQTWEATLSAIASVASAKGVSLSNDSSGVVSRLHFESGATVQKGQVLVELDTGVERARLASVRARLALARTSLDRSKALVVSGAIARSQVDADEASLKSLTADERALQAEIARKVIRAPFSGKLGIRAVNLGQYLAPGTTVASLESTDSVFADFTLPQRYLDDIAVGMRVRASVEGEKAPRGEGTVSAIEPAVDAVTRNVTVRASLSNQGELLRPGMFVKISVVLPKERRVIAIPLTAVVRASYGDSIFTVEAKQGVSTGKVARQSFVRLGETRGDYVAVTEGLKVGEEVVTSGAFKLRNGVPLLVDNTVKLNPDVAPHPENR